MTYQRKPSAASTALQFLAPTLQPDADSLATAAKALAELAATGWQQLSGYPGDSSPWQLRCQLCTWEGSLSLVQLRRRVPADRHPGGCLPAAQRAQQLAAITARLQPTCWCIFAHPVDQAGVSEVLDAIDYARSTSDLHGLQIHLLRLLGPCPAAAARAAALDALKAKA